MTIDITSFFFNSSIEGATATPAWGTSIGQNQSKACRIEDAKPGVRELLTGMLYKSISDKSRLDISAGSSNREVIVFSQFDKVYVNGTLLEDQTFVILLVRENTESHSGRLIISYPPYAQIDEVAVNDMAIKEMASALGCTENGCWFVYDISVVNQDELHFSAIVVNPEHPMVYKGKSRDRSRAWAEIVRDRKSAEGLDNPEGLYEGPTIQTIYYGCPGTGKSHQVKDLTEGLDNEKIIKFDDGTINVFRTTFHPDYDYATFVGCYKPVKENDKLDYKFVPQVFTNAYVTAKKHPEAPIYLIIEEINRGNCAQIFGDLFQLLDRENGESKFPIDAEEELMKYLRDEAQLDEYIKIKLPANFNIYATMNTSDQSLFPMDSAFKRRWEMKYIKIDYTNQEADYTFKVNGADYHWLEYLPCINDKITLATDSEDKQMGEFFIRANMSATEFKNKVMFYLWNDVCKDLYSGKNSPQSFFFRDIYGNPFKFTELFNEPAPDALEEDKKDPRKNGDLLLEGFLYYVKNGKKKAPKTEAITEQTVEEPEEGGEQPAE